jgi:hypothetical protein
VDVLLVELAGLGGDDLRRFEKLELFDKGDTARRGDLRAKGKGQRANAGRQQQHPSAATASISSGGGGGGGSSRQQQQ